MSYKIIRSYYSEEDIKKIEAIKDENDIIEYHCDKTGDNYYCSFLVRAEDIQCLTDQLQEQIGENPKFKIMVSTVDTVIPKVQEKTNSDKNKQEKKEKTKFLGISREELLEKISDGIKPDVNFFLLVFFSTLVAAIGMLEDNIAVVVGAMVIAPLLGPNLALAFGTTLGDKDLIKDSLISNIAGFSLCFLSSVIIGYFWTGDLESNELILRTDVSYSGIVLAISSGAAAVVSLTKGISSVMVGVMVAVALLPPATTSGIMLGAGQYGNSLGAALLLAVNIVCVNLSAKLIFIARGVSPRTWYEKKKARSTMKINLIIWSVSLTILFAIIYMKSNYL